MAKPEPVERDDLVLAVIEALQEQMDADAVGHFLNATAVTDVLLARYTITHKESS